MGNSPSVTSEFTSAFAPTRKVNSFEILDYIATHYILSMKYADYRNLSNRQYCDDMVLLTSSVIEKEFSHADISQLSSRIDGETGGEGNNGRKRGRDAHDEIFYTPKTRLPASDEKRRNCALIARFYIKLAQLFAAIISTVNPTYTYTDPSTHEKKHVDWTKNAGVTGLNPAAQQFAGAHMVRDKHLPNIIDQKLRILHTNPANACMHAQNALGQRRTLMDEPGVQELADLYKDVYDFDTNQFATMSESSKENYKKAARVLYESLHNKPAPANVQSFGDIELPTFSDSSLCAKTSDGDTPLMTPNEIMEFSDRDRAHGNVEMEAYADGIKKMIRGVAESQSKLMDIINHLFVFDSEGGVSVNPKITLDDLMQMSEHVRDTIVHLYAQAEKDYVANLHAFEKIAESQMYQSAQNKMMQLNRQKLQLAQEYVNITEQ